MTDDPRQWIAQVCRAAREDHGVGRAQIATAVGRESDAIRNFETLRGNWSPITGEIVNAYAELTGVEPSALWQAAIDRWREAEAAPVVPPQENTPTPSDIARSAVERAKRASSAARKRG